MQYARQRRIVSELGREPVKRFRRIGVCALDLDGGRCCGDAEDSTSPPGNRPPSSVCRFPCRTQHENSIFSITPQRYLLKSPVFTVCLSTKIANIRTHPIHQNLQFPISRHVPPSHPRSRCTAACGILPATAERNAPPHDLRRMRRSRQRRELIDTVSSSSWLTACHKHAKCANASVSIYGEADRSRYYNRYIVSISYLFFLSLFGY